MPRKRPSIQKREREYRKRQREQRKAEKAAVKREQRFSHGGLDAPPAGEGVEGATPGDESLHTPAPNA